MVSVLRRTAMVCLAFIVVSGCTRAINRSAERRIRDALPRLIGPAKVYRVHVTNDAIQTVEGHISNVDIEGDDVQLGDGMLIDRLHLALRDVVVDVRKHIVRRVGSAAFEATFGELAVNEYLAGEAASSGTVRNPKVRFGPENLVTLSAERMALGLGIPFSISGPVRVDSPQHVDLDPHRITVVGIPISGLPLELLKRHFEHGIDISTLPFPLNLRTVATSPGKLTLSGTADVEAVLAQAQALQD